MTASLNIVTAPTTEPVTLTEVKSQLRITGTDEDTYLGTLIVAAREYCERRQRRALITQTWDLFLDGWPAADYIQIPRPPLVSVTYVKYTDSAGTVTTWDTANYIVDSNKTPGVVSLAYSKSWPTATLRPTSPIVVQFVAGYGTAAAVPQTAKHAMLLIISHWYENREATTELSLKELPMAVESLLDSDCMFSGLDG